MFRSAYSAFFFPRLGVARFPLKVASLVGAELCSRRVWRYSVSHRLSNVLLILSILLFGLCPTALPASLRGFSSLLAVRKTLRLVLARSIKVVWRAQIFRRPLSWNALSLLRLGLVSVIVSMA